VDHAWVKVALSWGDGDWDADPLVRRIYIERYSQFLSGQPPVLFDGDIDPYEGGDGLRPADGRGSTGGLRLDQLRGSARAGGSGGGASARVGGSSTAAEALDKNATSRGSPHGPRSNGGIDADERASTPTVLGRLTEVGEHDADGDGGEAPPMAAAASMPAGDAGAADAGDVGPGPRIGPAQPAGPVDAGA
jgi:hypothetical protein